MINYLELIQVAQTCSICQEVVPDPTALLEHKRNVHSNNICYICAKSLLTQEALNNHILRLLYTCRLQLVISDVDF